MERDTGWKRIQNGEQDAILRRIQDGHGLKTERDLGQSRVQVGERFNMEKDSGRREI